MLLVSSVNTPIQDSRFHLLALRLRVQCGLCLLNACCRCLNLNAGLTWVEESFTPKVLLMLKTLRICTLDLLVDEAGEGFFGALRCLMFYNRRVSFHQRSCLHL